MRTLVLALTVAVAAAFPAAAAAPKPRTGARYVAVVRAKHRVVGQVHFQVSKTGRRVLEPSVTFSTTCVTQYGDRSAVRKVLAVFTDLRAPIKRTRRSSTVAFSG